MKNRKAVQLTGALAMVLTASAAQGALLAYDTFKASSSPQYSAGVYLQAADIVATSGNSTCTDTTSVNMVRFDASNAWGAFGTGSYFDANYGTLKLNDRTYSQDIVGRKHTADMSGKTVAWARVGMRMFPGDANNVGGRALAGFASNQNMGSTGGATVGFKWTGDLATGHWTLAMRYNDGNTSGAYATILDNPVESTVYNFFWSMNDSTDTVKVWLTTGADVVADYTDTPDVVVTDWAGATVSAATYLSVGYQYTDGDVWVYDAWLGDTAQDVGAIPEPGTLSLLGMATLGVLMIRRIRM